MRCFTPPPLLAGTFQLGLLSPLLAADESVLRRRSTKDPGQKPFSYQAGVGQVITGWDQGLLGMALNETREVIIPAEEGYGELRPCMNHLNHFVE